MEAFSICLRWAFVLLILHPGQAHSKELPPVLKNFIDYRENFVINVTKYVTKLFTKREELVRNCSECSRHSCSDDYLDFPCIQGLGTPEICTEEGRRVDYGSTIFRTPSGTDPTDLGVSIKENICIYRHLEEVVNKNLSDLFGWTYVGNQMQYFYFIPRSSRHQRWPFQAASRNGQEKKRRRRISRIQLLPSLRSQSPSVVCCSQYWSKGHRTRRGQVWIHD